MFLCFTTLSICYENDVYYVFVTQTLSGTKGYSLYATVPYTQYIHVRFIKCDSYTGMVC
jgi:hypothetical protein